MSEIGVRLIVNADDFGYTPAVNKGIVEAFERGIVSSTSLMVNQTGTGDALKLIKKGYIPCCGLHLVLTNGYPVSKSVKNLINSKGEFYSKEQLLKKSLDVKEIELEFSNQIMFALDADMKITHLDTHHHVHIHPDVFKVLKKVAKRFGLPVRNLNKKMKQDLEKENILTPDIFYGKWYGSNINKIILNKLIKKFSKMYGNIIEFMTHPGYVDSLLIKKSNYVYEREKELQILIDSEIRKKCFDLNIQICNYNF